MVAILGSAGSGKFTPNKPTLTYSGSGTSNNGKFRITNYDSALIYTTSGGTVSYDSGLGYYVFSVTAGTGSGTISAKSPKGITDSSNAIAYRQAATRAEYDQRYNPCGDLQFGYPTPGVWNWSCGCIGYNAGGGQWGVGICRKYPGSYIDYGGYGYTWSGTDYLNGSGEWWRIS